MREALREREVLLRAAPHIIWPLRFVLPYDSARRPAWMIRLGLFLYDHLGGRERLPASQALDLTTDPAGRPLKPELKKGFAYADCWVDDARLVVLNAIDAAERGAEILTRTRCTAARRANELWYAELDPGRRRAPPARCGRARWSMPPAPGSRASRTRRCRCRVRATCAWSRAATSSCPSSTSTPIPTSCRTTTAAWCSRSPTRATTR